MKLGIIFKKEFQDEFGEKREFVGDEITIKQNPYELIITAKNEGEIEKRRIPVNFIQLIYLGRWKD